MERHAELMPTRLPGAPPTTIVSERERAGPEAGPFSHSSHSAPADQSHARTEESHSGLPCSKASSSRSIASSSSFEPMTFGPLNHFFAEATHHRPTATNDSRISGPA